MDVLEKKVFTYKLAIKAIEEFKKIYQDFHIATYNISDYEQVVVVEDSTVFYIKIDPNCEFTDEEHRRYYVEKGVCGLDIEEMTENDIFTKYNHAKFIRDVEKKYNTNASFVRYGRFCGVNNKYLPNNMISHYKYVNHRVPQIHLKERLSNWNGFSYNIVGFEMEANNGELYYAIDAIKGNVQPHVLKVGNSIIKQSYGYSKTRGIGLADMFHYMDDRFIDAFQSYKNERKVWRLQEHMKYFFLENTLFKDQTEIRPYILSVIRKINTGEYKDIEKIPYIQPEYKWKSEELVYKLIRKAYKEYGVIYQHRPYYLKSSKGGQMSYDVYISDFKIAVEYQGKQHFEPVDFFGGEDAFKNVVIRDKEKAELSKKNGVKLVYINYWEEIDLKLIKKRIEEAHICQTY